MIFYNLGDSTHFNTNTLTGVIALLPLIEDQDSFLTVFRTLYKDNELALSMVISDTSQKPNYVYIHLDKNLKKDVRESSRRTVKLFWYYLP